MKPNRPCPRWPSTRPALRNWQLARLRRYLGATVLPFSGYYGGLFERERIDVRALRSSDDLRRIPFTTKSDFAPNMQCPDPLRAFLLKPEREILARRFR